MAAAWLIRVTLLESLNTYVWSLLGNLRELVFSSSSEFQVALNRINIVHHRQVLVYGLLIQLKYLSRIQADLVCLGCLPCCDVDIVKL